MQRKQLRKKEIKELNEVILDSFGKADCIDKKAKVELADKDKIFINDELAFFYHDKELVPTLKTLLKDNFLKKITVDMGAVKFVTNGADIMRPGIVEIEDGIEKGQIISIIDIKHKKPLAIGVSLGSTEELRSTDSGKAIQNIHFIGDEFWSF